MIFRLQISSVTLAFYAWIPGFVDVRSVAGVDLLSLDGRRAVRCSNTTLPCQEVKRFIRVARWIYKAAPRNGNAIAQCLVAHTELIKLGPRYYVYRPDCTPCGSYSPWQFLLLMLDYVATIWIICVHSIQTSELRYV